MEKSAVTSISDDLLGYCWCQASNLNKSELQGYESTALAVGSEDTADIEAGHESLWIYDLRFSLAGHGRLISFFRHIGEESNPHRRFAALGHCVRSALVPSLAATPRSRYTPFGVPENMSKRELKALQVAPVPTSPPADQPEPEAEAEDDQVAAEAARLQRVQEQIEAELTRARESVKSFKEAFGRREPAAGEAASWKSSLCCLVASAPEAY